MRTGTIGRLIERRKRLPQTDPVRLREDIDALVEPSLGLTVVAVPHPDH